MAHINQNFDIHLRTYHTAFVSISTMMENTPAFKASGLVSALVLLHAAMPASAKPRGSGASTTSSSSGGDHQSMPATVAYAIVGVFALVILCVVGIWAYCYCSSDERRHQRKIDNHSHHIGSKDEEGAVIGNETQAEEEATIGDPELANPM